MRDRAVPFSQSQGRAAMTAALSLVAMALLAPVAMFAVLERIVVEGDPGATATNLAGGLPLFRASIVAFWLVAMLDIIVAWALYIVLEPVDSRLSMLAAWFRLAYAAIFTVASVSLIDSINLITDAHYLEAFGQEQLNAQLLAKLNGFYSTWNLGLAVFGCHLLVLGCLVFCSGFIPRFLGGLIVLSGLGYLVDMIGSILWSGYALPVASMTFIGEVLLIFWLFRLALKKTV